MVHVLDLPWGFQAKDVYYDKAKKVHFYKGTMLPPDLRRFSSEDFSYNRWVEDEQNKFVLPPQKFDTKFTPRSHQIEAAKAILQSYRGGWAGFLEADKTGLGKTLSTLAGISAIAKTQGYTPSNKAAFLVVCPKGVIPQWRHTLHRYPTSTSLLRPLIINYQQLNKLLEVPPSASYVKAKKQKTKNRLTASHGKPKIDFPFIIFDEAHYLKNYPSSSASIAAVNIAQLNKAYVKGRSPFVVFSTATPGASPLNFAVMSKFLGPLITDKAEGKKVTPDSWGDFLQAQGFAVKKGKVTWSWAATPWYGKGSDDPVEAAKYERAAKKTKALQRKDAQRIGRGLTKPGAPFIMRSPSDLAGWPEQQVIALPLAMTADQIPVYEEAWSRFRDWLRLTPAKSDPKGALVEMLRYRQKASLLKVAAMAEQTKDWVEAGNQVFISCEFLETLDQLNNGLVKADIPVSEISGRNSREREDERIRFQKGKTQVCICTVVAGISLHSNEHLPDGTRATPTPRISAILDVRQNNLDTSQAMGRAHRDGENSLTYFPYLEGTVDERVIQSFVNKTANMNSMMGASLESSEELERMFREAAAKSRVS